MQVTKAFSGTLANIGSTSARPYKFGNTVTHTGYWEKIDFINQTISDFLNEMGVDAAYEARQDDPNKFLWINGVPFLYFCNSSYERWGIATLYNGASSNLSNSANVMLFYGASSGIYSFSLIFTGNPKGAFSLRFKGYNSTAVSSYTFVRYIKSKNLLNGKDSLVWVLENGTANLGNCNGIDLNADGTLDPDSFSNTTITYLPSLAAKPINKTSGEGHFPLIPLLFGIWKPHGVYCHVRGFGLPDAMGTTVENQTEIEISGRRFINTTAENLGSGFINIGLIEVDD